MKSNYKQNELVRVMIGGNNYFLARCVELMEDWNWKVKAVFYNGEELQTYNEGVFDIPSISERLHN